MSKHLLTAAGVFLLTAGLAANIGAAAPDDKETAPDGRYVAAWRAHHLVLWDLEDGTNQVIQGCGPPTVVTSATFGARGLFVVCADFRRGWVDLAAPTDALFPGFMPPELLRGIVPAYTPDVDTFALGCTLAVLLSRSPVAVGALRPSLVRRILAEAGLTGIAASTLHHIICRAISISPAERWEDGDTLAAELEDWVSLMADAATEAPAPHATLARRSRTAS